MKHSYVTQSNAPIGEPKLPINLDQVRYLSRYESGDDYLIRFHFTETHTLSWKYDNEANRDAEFALLR